MKKDKKPSKYKIVLSILILTINILCVFFKDSLQINTIVMLTSELLAFAIFSYSIVDYINHYKLYLKMQKNIFSIKTYMKTNIKTIIIITIIIIFALIGCFCLSRGTLEKSKNSAVMIEVYDEDDKLISTGSGFCAEKNNYIVTNFHVIEGAYKVKVVTDKKEKYDVKNIIIFDYKTDLAIMEVDTNLMPIKLGFSSSIKTGKNIIAIGSPLGELNTVSTGIISNADNDKGIQISAPISHGSSGGVLLDSNYRVIGITYAGIENGQNLNYAIDVKYLKELISSLKEKEYVTIVETNSISWPEAVNNKKTFVNKCYIQENNNGNLGFNGCAGKNEKYYSTETLEEFYKITNKYQIYDNLMIEKNTGTYEKDYEKLNIEKRKLAAELYDQFKFENDIKKISISSMENHEIIYDLSNRKYSYFLFGISKSQIANTLADIEPNENNLLCFEKVNRKELNRGEKIMFGLLYCGMNISELHFDDRKYFAEYILDLKLTQIKKEEILKYFGYTVENGKVYY